MRDNAMITKVTTDELRKMRGKEGLVFQGCSPPYALFKIMKRFSRNSPKNKELLVRIFP